MPSSLPRVFTVASLILLALLTNSARAQSLPATPHTPDMLGIYPGMPARAARAVLQKHSSQYQVQDNTPPETGFSLMIPDPQHRDITTVDLTQAPNEPAVWRISRGQTLSNLDQMSVQALLTAVREKYGKETISQDHGGGGLYLYWIFDPNGRLLASADAALTACNPASFSVLMRNHSPISPTGPEQVCYRSFFAVVAQLNRGGNPELLQAYNVQLVNLPYAFVAATNTLKVDNNAAEKERQKQMKKANDNKPVF